MHDYFRGQNLAHEVWNYQSRRPFVEGCIKVNCHPHISFGSYVSCINT
ncbi:hypothetical protein ES332_D13G165800v1 [Gossypium tomentosum]|uniref:Uncharacterized protein n=1 Tax=Gossypium tomentosum TaxID=34277 RepID=A0A5D2HXU5_GOSTO|nr:hypothetical protein ES332_D13G165800v1 [Gossypium tomentosum]